jgi:uncharacterized protein YgbK (DUF1537 family)
MDESPVLKDDLFSSLPPEGEVENLFSMVQSAVGESYSKVVIVDDDPLGTQTVYGLPVLTEWSVDSLTDELKRDFRAFYILTNSRSMPPIQAAIINSEVGRNLAEASRLVGSSFSVISRCDSTLRGHFPYEVEALANGLGCGFDAWIFIPFFLEGGRYTINDVHYVEDDEMLVPVGMTEFARDSAFGYHSSNLRKWIAEKTEGRIDSDSVCSVTIEDLRIGGVERIVKLLLQVPRGGICIVNAASMADLLVFTIGFLEAEKQGRKFLCRTASSFVQARLGLKPRGCLSRDELPLRSTGGGLIVVGSHVPRTTTQLRELLMFPGITAVELPVRDLFDKNSTAVVEKVVDQVNDGLAKECDTVVYTSREVLRGTNADESLAISRRVSEALVEIVRSVYKEPRYLLVKGGVTASDICVHGLNVRRAMVLGQIFPGVPVWQLSDESRWRGLACVIFPGNVGGPKALAEVVSKLSAG